MIARKHPLHSTKAMVGLALICLLWLTGCSLIGNDVIVSGDTLFEDRFVSGETGNWLTETDGTGQTLIINEAMVVQINEPNTVQYAALQEPNFSDFILELDMTLLEGSKNSTYGILLRMVNGEQFYRFSLTGNGVFIIEKHIGGGAWERLTEGWEEASPILKGLNQTNQVRIEAIGAQMNFYVNSQLLRQVVDPDYANGRIALSAGTFNTGGTRVAFDNVVLTQP